MKIIMESYKPLLLLLIIFISGCTSKQAETVYPSTDRLFEYSSDITPAWVSFENPTGEKGKGSLENNGAKGHAYDMIKPGETKTLLDIEGSGIINRIWITIREQSEYSLRSLVINMYWDNEEKPAVSSPLGDFFGVGLGKTAVFENELFVNPEGRSFVSYAQMPFKKAAKIEIVNEMDIPVTRIFYDINLQRLKKWNDNFLYFHSYWHRDTSTTLAKDFEILPVIEGKGRFLGSNISVVANPEYEDNWWGEGEIKIYLDEDTEHPSLVGTGTEDYIGTAWGQGVFSGKYSGCTVADIVNNHWAFYRYHIIDPIYFRNDCKVTIQQIGGSQKQNVIDLQKNNVDLIPVTISERDKIHLIYKKDDIVNLDNHEIPGDISSWVNFYRSDDLSSVAYFYLDKPTNNLPNIQKISIRTWGI